MPFGRGYEGESGPYYGLLLLLLFILVVFCCNSPGIKLGGPMFFLNKLIKFLLVISNMRRGKEV